MIVTLDIIPGEAIRPFRLRMTGPEIDEALRSIAPEPITLSDLGIMAGDNDALGRCQKLGVCVVNNQHTILLNGQSVNDISNDKAIELFMSLSPNVRHSYGGFEIAELGLDAVRWEHSDTWLDSIFVMPARKPPQGESAPVFGSQSQS